MSTQPIRYPWDMSNEDTHRQTLSNHLRSRLKQLRLDSGYSQRALAEKIGVSISMISMVESGTRDTSVGTLEAWAQACGAQLDAVKAAPDTERLSLDHLTDQQRQLVVDLVANLPAFGSLLETTLRQLVWIWTAEASRTTRRL